MNKLNYLDLKFLPYGGKKLPSYFKYNKEDQELVDFYNEDAKDCQNQSISRVINVYYEEKFVAYYAYSSSEIKAAFLSAKDKVAPFAHPAIKLGRLLVCNSMRGKGIGTCILQDIAKIALKMRDQIPLRFLLVDSLPQALTFYKNSGFIDTDIKRGSKRDLSLLYIDLNKIPG